MTSFTVFIFVSIWIAIGILLGCGITLVNQHHGEKNTLKPVEWWGLITLWPSFVMALWCGLFTLVVFTGVKKILTSIMVLYANLKKHTGE